MEEARRLGRPIPLSPVRRLVGMVRAAFMSRRRREAFRTLAGYALLEG